MAFLILCKSYVHGWILLETHAYLAVIYRYVTFKNN